MVGDSGPIPILGASVNQSDRLSGIADYLSGDGTAEKLLWIAGILTALLVLILILRWVNRAQERQRRARRAKKHPPPPPTGPRRRSPPAGANRRGRSQPPRRR